MTRAAPTALAGPTARLLAHRRLLLCAIAGALVGFFWPGIDSGLARALVGWNVLVWLYLLWVAVALAGADSGHIKRLALAQAESAAIALAIVVAAAMMSLVVLVFELLAAKAAGPQHMLPHLVFAFASVLGSWLLLPTLFALTYASAYYGPDPDRGLAFPESPKGFEPDHTDFLYFSFTIAVASQTSDVVLRSTAVRRTALAQSVLSFFFNVAVLGLSVNIAAGLVGS